MRRAPRASRASSWMAVAAFAVALASCGDEAAPSAPSAPAEPPAVPSVEIPDATTVRLIDAGSEPREELRFSAPVAERQTISLRQRTSLEVLVDGQPVPKRPDIGWLVMSLQAERQDSTSTDADANTAANTVRYTITLVGADVEGGSIDETAQQTIRERLRMGLGLRGDVERDALGNGRTLAVSPPPGIDSAPPGVMAGVQLLVDAVGVPLPTEAVGIGARWEVVSAEDNQGARARLTRTFELLARDGAQLSLAVTIEKQGAPGTMRPPGLPPGAEFEVRQLAARGSGTVQVSLDALLPSGASIVTEDHATFDLVDGQRRSRMRRTSKVELSIE